MTRFILAAYVVLLSNFSVAAAYAGSQAEYLTELVNRARELRLAEHKEWLNLVHYRSNYFSGYTSEIISPSFFTAPDGRTNPSAELEATLASFFSTIEETDKQQNPQCRYISRYHWLKQKLAFSPARLPEKRCRRFEKWIENIEPDQVTLIFPAGTDNTPSSMFGHTLFRIDQKGQSEKTRLRSYSINFAAETTETDGLIFAINGIFGGYPGRFSIMPYYEKVKQYNDMEHRDIWEYQLNLSKDEIHRLLQHTWELGQTDFAYYFFLENCSYQLLSLLDVARPGHNLKDRFSVWAIPADTVTVLLDDATILKKAVFRPSVRSQLRYQISQLNGDEQDMVMALAYGEITPADPTVTALSDERRALVIITAYDYLQYMFNRGEATQTNAAGRSLGLLRARNKIPLTSTVQAMAMPEVRFDQGHGTSRFAIGGGSTERNDVSHNFTEIKYRPAYHSLLDNQKGYTKGAQINFTDFTFRYNDVDETVRLQEWMIIDINSLSPRDNFFKSLSWKINTGFVRRPLGKDYEDVLAYSVNGGFGLTYGMTDDLNVFMMLDFTLLFQDQLRNKATIGAGPSAGMLWRLTSFWSMWLSGSVQHFEDSVDLAYVDYRMEHNFALTTNTALRLSAIEKGDREHSDKEVQASLNWYFK